MTEPKFTPGPWAWQRVPHPCIADHVGFQIDAGDVEIADIHVKRRPVAVREANASLIAAAPELYAALDWLLEQPPEHDLDGKAEKRERAAARKAAIDALAKARGETP